MVYCSLFILLCSHFINIFLSLASLQLGDVDTSLMLMPYTNDVYIVEEIYFPGAIFMTVDFSADTSIETDYDFVQLFMDPHLLVPVEDAYSGTDFPGVTLDTLSILGNRFYFTFVSDDESYEIMVGYNMQVTPVYGKCFTFYFVFLHYFCLIWYTVCFDSPDTCHVYISASLCWRK